MRGEAAMYRTSLFLLRRLYGLTLILNGLLYLLTPWRTGLSIKVARAIARERGQYMMLKRTAE